jgi:ABC-type polysaccharide/polyol phosphate export permease
MLALLALATGVGLVVASVAVRFHDAVDITAVLIQITAFAAPVFYPLSVIPSPFRVLIELNPLTQILLLERALLYGGTLGAWQNWIGSFGSAAVALTGGIFVFARGWKQSAVML